MRSDTHDASPGIWVKQTEADVERVAVMMSRSWVPECRIHPAVPDSRDFDSGFAGFARFRFWVCRIRGIHNFVLPNWPFCSSVVVRETAGLNGFRELSEIR